MTRSGQPHPDGLILVPIATKHAGTVVRWRNEPGNRVMFLGNETITLASQIGFTARIRADSSDMTRIAICRGRPAGMVALYGIRDGAAEYGRVLVDGTVRRQGIGRAISGLILAAGFARLGLERIHANCLVSNTAIHALLEALGFVRGAAWHHAASGREVLRLELDRATWHRHPARAFFEVACETAVPRGDWP